jgi:hypothetical protein
MIFKAPNHVQYFGHFFADSKLSARVTFSPGVAQ